MVKNITLPTIHLEICSDCITLLLQPQYNTTCFYDQATKGNKE